MAQQDILAFAVAMGFAAGLNVYATVLSLGAMARFHWIDLPLGLHALSNGWVLSASGALFTMELVADKVPGFDLVWNALHTFVRIPVAALLAYAAGSQLSPELRLLATCLGTGFAAMAHATKSAARVAVTPSPEPGTNIALSSVEDAGAIGLSWVAVHHPVIGAAIAGAFAAAGVAVVWWTYRLVRSGLRSISQRFRRKASAH